MSVNLGKFLGASNNGEDNVYNLATVLERGDLKRCALCSTYKKRVHTCIHTSYLLNSVKILTLNLQTHTHLQKTNDMRFYWRSNVAQLKHPAPHYTNTREIIR